MKRHHNDLLAKNGVLVTEVMGTIIYKLGEVYLCEFKNHTYQFLYKDGLSYIPLGGRYEGICMLTDVNRLDVFLFHVNVDTTSAVMEVVKGGTEHIRLSEGAFCCGGGAIGVADDADFCVYWEVSNYFYIPKVDLRYYIEKLFRTGKVNVENTQRIFDIMEGSKELGGVGDSTCLIDDMELCEGYFITSKGGVSRLYESCEHNELCLNASGIVSFIKGDDDAYFIICVDGSAFYVHDGTVFHYGEPIHIGDMRFYTGMMICACEDGEHFYVEDTTQVVEKLHECLLDTSELDAYTKDCVIGFLLKEFTVYSGFIHSLFTDIPWVYEVVDYVY